MSGTLDCLTVRWNEACLSKEQQWTVSPKFRYRKEEWMLYCRETSGEINLHLLPTNWSFALYAQTFWVSVQVESGKTGRVFPELCQKDYFWTRNKTCVWSKKINDVQGADTKFKSSQQLTFRVTLEKTDSQTDTTSVDPKKNYSNNSTQTLVPFYAKASDQTSLKVTTSSCLDSLSEDVFKLLDQESDTDVVFQCGGHSTKAHKLIASARSPILASLLHKDMVERNKRVVKIPDMDVDIFKHFFRYLYSGKLDELTFDTAVSLYKVGNLYEVHGLTKRCSEFLTKNLPVSNPYDVLVLAHSYNDTKFFEAVNDYMVKHKFPLSGHRWSNFCEKQPKLANQVLNRFCQKSKWTGWKN